MSQTVFLHMSDCDCFVCVWLTLKSALLIILNLVIIFSASSACWRDWNACFYGRLNNAVRHKICATKQKCYFWMSPFVMACIPGPNIQSNHVGISCCQCAFKGRGICWFGTSCSNADQQHHQEQLLFSPSQKLTEFFAVLAFLLPHEQL